MNPSPNALPAPSPPGALSAADALLDALPWGVLVLDEQCLIRRANPAAARWCGAPPAALPGQPLAGLALPPAVQAALLQLLEPGAAGPREAFVPACGQWIAFSASRPAGGGWVLYGHDITERRQREATLRASEEQQAFRLRLSDALAALTSPADVPATAARALGEYLGTDGACYVDVEGEAAHALVAARDWPRPGAPRPARPFLPGTWPMPWLLNGQAWVCPDVDTDPTLPDEQRAHYRAQGIRAAVVVPLLKHGRLVATLVASQATPRAWTPPEVTLVAETVARTWVALARTRAEQALAASEAKYRALFDAIDEGCTTLEVLFDEAGRAVDYRFLELNQAYERITGVPRSVAGKRGRELRPDLDEALLQHLEKVVLTGEPARYEQYVPGLDCWLDVHTARVGGDGSHTVASVFTDITARKRREANLAFLADLNVDFAPRLSAEQIMARVSEQLAAYLHLSRCHLAVVDAPADHLAVTFDWRRAAELPPLLGEHRIADYLTAAGRQHFGAGHPLVLTGQEASPFVSTPLDVLAARGFGSSVDIPLLIDGRWRFMLTAARAAPGAWRPDEVELLQQLASRIHTRLARAQAETALQEAHAQLAGVLERTNDAFYTLDAKLCFTYVNQRAAQLWGRPPTALIGQCYWQEFPQGVGTEVYRQHQQVLQSGQPAHFETVSPILGTWIEASIYPGRAGGLSVFFRDITARKRAEANLAFLAEISQDLVLLTHIGETMRVLGAKIGRHFGAARCAFFEFNAAMDQVVCEHDWHRADVPSLVGRYHTADFYTADFLQTLRAGEPVVVRDSATDARVNAQNLAALSVAAYIVVPISRDKQLRFMLCLYDGEARDWHDDEINLMRELTTRLWTRLERSNAEEARHASEQRLRAVMENLPGGAVFVVDAGLRYQMAEGAALHQLGLRPADFVGRPVQELAPPALWPDFERLYKQALAGQPFEYEHAQGGRTFATRGGPLRDAGGAVAAVLAVSYDVTARKQAEEALRLSEARLSLALQAGRMGSFEWSSAGSRLTLSAMSAEVLGLQPGTPIATSAAFLELVHPDDRARHQALFGEAGSTGTDFHSIYRIVRPRDGAVRWLEERGQGTRDPATSGVCLRGVHWDVTEPMLAQQRLAEFNSKLEQRVARRTRELQASRDLLQSVFDTNLIAMSVLEAVRDAAGAVQDFRLRLVSRELARETGRTDLVGKLYAQEYPGIREAGIFDLVVRTVATGEPHGMEYHYHHEGFDKWFACQFVKLGDGVVATNLDITERKTAEQERLQNLRLLEQAEAVAGLGSWDYELATGTLRWSDGMYQLFGLPVGSAVAPADYLRRVVAEDRPRARRLVRRLATGASDFEETLRLRVRDQVKTVRMKAVVLRDAQGQALRMLGIDLDISELQRLEQDNLHLRLRQQRALFEAVQAAQEAERQRMAESLHNGIGQILYATKLHLDRLHVPLLSTDPAVTAARHAADLLLGEAIRQTRALSHELVPMVLAEFGLAAALQDICRHMSTPQLYLCCQVAFDAAAAPLGPALQMALYRMAQELAQNIAKHAHGATEAAIELETMPGWVLLRAEDNGPGFPPAPARAARAGLGLRSIRDRVALLGGQLETGSFPTGGAYVRIRIPLPAPSPPGPASIPSLPSSFTP